MCRRMIDPKNRPRDPDTPSRAASQQDFVWWSTVLAQPPEGQLP